MKQHPILFRGPKQGRISRERWYQDEQGRIHTIATFCYGDFDEMPIFVRTVLQHNGRITEETS